MMNAIPNWNNDESVAAKEVDAKEAAALEREYLSALRCSGKHNGNH